MILPIRTVHTSEKRELHENKHETERDRKNRPHLLRCKGRLNINMIAILTEVISSSETKKFKKKKAMMLLLAMT